MGRTGCTRVTEDYLQCSRKIIRRKGLNADGKIILTRISVHRNQAFGAMRTVFLKVRGIK